MMRGTQSAHDYAGGGYGRQEPVHVPSPADMARDTVVELERDNRDLQRRVAAVRAAHDANDPEKWREARGRLDAGIREAVQAQERTRGREADMDAHARGRANAAARELAKLEATAASLTEAPKGFAHFHGEHEIQRVLGAPLEGGAAAGNQRKEQELRELFAVLSPADSRTLAERLRRARENDPLVKAFQRITAERRQRLLRYLDEAPKRAALDRESELRAQKTPAHESYLEIDVLDHPHFEVTELGSISKPIQVSYLVHSEEPITIDSFSVDTQDPARAGEIDVITRASGTVLKNGDPLTIEVAFRPKTPAALHAYLMLHGHTATKPVKKGALLIAPAPSKAIDAHKDANEFALADRASRDVETGHEAATTGTYPEMLAAVLAAERLTGHEQREHAHELLEAVERRLEQLDDVAHEKLADFGFAHTAGYVIFDGAKSAIRLWLAKLKLGSSITTAPLVIEFRAGAEAIKLCTGESKDARNLRALDKASYYTLAGAGVLATAPAALAMVVEEAGLLAFAARSGARSLTIWALHNPAAALAASEALAGFGIQIGEDGWEAFAAQLEDPRGRMFIVMQVLMDTMHVHAAGGEPQARAVRGGSQSAPLPDAASLSDETIATTRARLEKVGEIVQSTTVRANAEKQTSEPRARSGVHGSEPQPGEHDTAATSKPAAAPSHGERAPMPELQPARSNTRVTTPVHGVYDSIDPSPSATPAGWVFRDSRMEAGSLYTEITAPNGATGHVWRNYDPYTKQWVMKEAFFAKDMPSWIEAGTPMVQGKGTPLIAYLDMRLMKSYNIDYGGLKSVKLSTIQNVEAICELEAQRRETKDLNAAVRNTASVRYAETELVQSGHQIASVKLSGGRKTPIDRMLTHYENAGFRPKADHDAILQKYGIARGDEVLWDYDIEIDLVPFPGGKP